MEFLKFNFNSTKAIYFAKEILNIPTTAVVVDKNISYKNTPIPIGEGNAPAFECRLLKGFPATCFKFIQRKPRLPIKFTQLLSCPAETARISAPLSLYTQLTVKIMGNNI